MRYLMIVALLVCMSGTAMADKWSKLDITLEGTFTTLMIVDYMQTVEIIRAPIDENRRESNPIMGRHGERVPPEAYFPVMLLGHMAIAHVLPSPYRKIWQGVGIAVQVDAVKANWQAGYTFSF
jgi:hypothetical protein